MNIQELLDFLFTDFDEIKILEKWPNWYTYNLYIKKSEIEYFIKNKIPLKVLRILKNLEKEIRKRTEDWYYIKLIANNKRYNWKYFDIIKKLNKIKNICEKYNLNPEYFGWISKEYYDNLIEEAKQLIKQENKKEKDILEEWYIYIIKRNWKIKIGITKDINTRLKKYITEHPDPIEIIYTKKVFGYKELEKKLHKLFENKRIRGERFNLSENDINKAKEIVNKFSVY